MTASGHGGAASGPDARSQVRLIHAATEYLMTEDFEELSRTMVLEMTLDMLATVIAGGDLKATADYIAHYCDVLGTPEEAEQIAGQIEASVTRGE